MEINSNAATICGLFCGTCPKYLKECNGCLSEGVSNTCANGFYTCAKEHNITRCYECSTFPCERLNKFKDKHYENGIGHHKDIIENLKFMKAYGVETWLEKQISENTCPKCGEIIYWYDKGIHKC